jgi:hypothetical protein
MSSSLTPQQLTRRQGLADAASLGIERARVLLYACLPDDDKARAAMRDMETHASARDWDIAMRFYDRIATPRMDGRGRWPLVQWHIVGGKAQGIIVPTPETIGDLRERERFRVWLDGYGAWFQVLPTPEGGGHARS